MNTLLRIFKNPSLLTIIFAFLFFFYFSNYQHEYQKNQNLILKITSITKQLEHYQSELKRYNDTANLAEQKKRKLEQEREKTAEVINQIRNSDTCFNAAAPLAIVERLRQQATADNHNKTPSDSH